MSSRAFRNTVTALLVSTTVTLACAAPSHASWFHPPRAGEEVERNVPVHGLFVSVLLRLYELAGGAMDPNGGTH